MSFEPAVPGDLSIVKASQYLSPPADEEPLRTILKNANWLYAKYQPPLVNVVWTAVSVADRSTQFIVPILPSADGLSYTFRHMVQALTFVPANEPLSITVEEWTGAVWSSLESTGYTIAASDNTWITYSHDDPIDATATMLRITYDRDNSSEYTPGSLLVYPNPGAVGAGKKTSGFWPFDNGLLTAAGAPLNVEHHNRASRNAAAVLADRAQMVASFAQESTAGAVRWTSAMTPLAAGQWVKFGRAVATFPGQRDPLLQVRVIASVSAGATADLVMLRQVGGAAVALDATGSVDAGTLLLDLDAAGTDGARAELEIYVRATAGNTTYLHACCASWIKGE